jgi:CHAD domain-containing protein
MRETHELELKLTPGPGFRLPSEQDARTRSFTSAYYDTAGLRLAEVGITLRRRIENRKTVWQLKLPLAAGRRELEVAAGPARPPAELSDLLVAVTRRAPLEPVASLRTERTFVQVREDGAVAEIAHDAVAVLEGRRVRERFEEVEVELLDGDAKALGRIGKELRRAGAADGDGRPKLFRVLAFEPAEVTPDAAAPPLVHLRVMLGQQLTAMLRHDPGVRLGRDPEDLHDMRVATRRLRALLRAARPLLDRGWAEELRSELSWLGSVLGPVRDLDVLLEHLRGEADALPGAERRAAGQLVRALEAERESARAALLEALESDRYLSLLDSVEAAAGEPRAADGNDLSLKDIAGAEFDRLRKAVKKLPADPSDDELHRARIKTKRARYAAELAKGALGKPAARFVDRAKRLQDVIGEHQDALVAEERLRSLLRSVRGSQVAFATGLLVERERARRRAARAEWPRAWKKLERSGKRAWA